MDLSSFENSGFKATEIDTGIYLVEDFITEEERSYIYDVAESATEEDWCYGYMQGLKVQSMEKYGNEDYTLFPDIPFNEFWVDKTLTLPDEDLSDRLTKRMSAFFDPSYSLRNFSNIQRQKPGVALPEHHDRGYDDRLHYASVTYINDNYLDGELYFPDRGLSLRPPAKSLIIFSSGEEYIHGVKPVGDGPTRYVITSFVWTEDGVV